VNGFSKGGILVCEECGQRVVLDGPLEGGARRAALRVVPGQYPLGVRVRRG
jgi:hypothetical protein